MTKDGEVFWSFVDSSFVRYQCCAATNSRPNQYVATVVRMPAMAEGSRSASGVTPSSRNMPATSHMCSPSRP